MGLTVSVLGCNGSYAAPGGACTGYLVESDETAVWLDAGPGTLANIQRHRSLLDIDAIVLTHEHPDHWLELPVVFNALRFYVPRRDVPVYGTAGTKALADQLIGEMAPVMDWTTITESDELSIGDQQWRFSRTDHPVETLAVRADAGGRSFAYSSDTAAGWQVEKLGRGIDLVLCEATVLAEHEGQGIPHLSARQAGTMAREAEVGQLVITHLMPGADIVEYRLEAQEAFGRAVSVADIDGRYEA